MRKDVTFVQGRSIIMRSAVVIRRVASVAMLLCFALAAHAQVPAPAPGTAPAPGSAAGPGAAPGSGSGAASRPAPPAFTDKPGLPAGEPQSARIAALIEAVNSGDRETMLGFIKANCSPRLREELPDGPHADIMFGIARQSGGYELHGLRTYDPPKPPSNRTVIVRSRLLENWEAFIIEFEPQPPYRIDRLSTSRARPPAGVQSDESLTLDQAAARLKASLERLAKADVFSGSAILAKDGKVIFSFVSGEASKAYAALNKVDTKFNLGSMNKMFTAVAVAQLVEAGKLSFDDPVGKYLGADWIAPEYASKITLAHLLSHTSGLGSHFTDEFWKTSRTLFRDLDDFKPLVVHQAPAFEPGAKWAYSNSGFLLLGAVVEKASGERYDDYVAAHILKPAGMTDTGCFEMDLDTPNLAIGYSYEFPPPPLPGSPAPAVSPGSPGSGKPRWVNNLFKHVIKGGPAGGGFSTAPDLLRFDQALRSGKLVSKETLDMLWSPKPASPDYGFGFQLDGGAPGISGSAGRIVGHGGGFPGISSVLDMYPETGLTFIAMCNYDDAAVLAGDKSRELLAKVK